MKTLCFIGHRPESLPFGENELDARYIRLKAMLLAEIMDRAAAGYDTFICGAERGIDILFGRQVLLVKLTSHPNIRLVCAISHTGQADGWPREWKGRYAAMLEQADETVLISKEYASDCRRKRNRYMADAASAALAVYDGGRRGETAVAVEYAMQRGIEAVVVNPLNLERTVIPAKAADTTI